MYLTTWGNKDYGNAQLFYLCDKCKGTFFLFLLVIERLILYNKKETEREVFFYLYSNPHELREKNTFKT